MKKKEIILLPFAVFFLIGLLYLSQFNTFQTDDYNYALQSRELGGAANNALLMYQNWGGRLWSFFAIGFLGKNFIENDWFPKLYVVGSLFLLVFLIFINIKAYLKVNNQKALAKSIIFSFLYLAAFFRLDEVLFWVSGSQVYFFADMYLLLFAYVYKKYADGFIKSVLLIMLSFLVIFSNEVSAIILLTCQLWIFKYHRNKFNRITLIFACLFFVVTFLAPGNYARVNEDVTLNQRLITAVKIAPFLAIVLIIKSIIPAFLIWMISDFKFTIKRKQIYQFALVILIPYVFLVAIMMMSGRTYNALLIVLIPFFVLVFQHIFDDTKKSKKTAKILFGGCMMLLLFPPVFLFPKKQEFIKINYHTYDIASDLFSGTAKKYFVEAENRKKILKSSQGKTVFLPAIQNIPKTLYFEEVPHKDTLNYKNISLMNYYKIDKIWLKESNL